MPGKKKSWRWSTNLGGAFIDLLTYLPTYVRCTKNVMPWLLKSQKDVKVKEQKLDQNGEIK